MSLFSSKFIKEINQHLNTKEESEIDIGYREKGYLFLSSTEEGKKILERNASLQQLCGGKPKLLSPFQIHQSFPFLNPDGFLFFIFIIS